METITKSNFTFLDAYAPLFNDKTYYIISGGRGSGKTTNVLGYFVMKLLSPEYFRGVIARYSMASVKNTIHAAFIDEIHKMGLEHLVQIEGDEIRCKYNRNKIITHAMKLAEGTMSAKGKGLNDITHLLIDEAQELPSEEEYIKLVDTIRTPNVERKIFVMFNPGAKSHWIHQRWFVDGEPNPKWFDRHCFIHTTYEDNPMMDSEKVREWTDMKHIDPHYYKYHILGYWKDYVEGRVFDTWDFDYEPDHESDTIYGLDFGFSGDPCALIQVNRKGNTLWLKELMYDKGRTNQDISDIMTNLGVKKTDRIIADAAEPKSIEELKRMGWNIEKCYKGPDSITSGIQKVQQMRVHVDPSSENLLYEYQNYAWNGKTGKPVDRDNHLMDALRYALSLDKKTVSRYGFSGIRR